MVFHIKILLNTILKPLPFAIRKITDIPWPRLTKIIIVVEIVTINESIEILLIMNCTHSKKNPNKNRNITLQSFRESTGTCNIQCRYLLVFNKAHDSISLKSICFLKHDFFHSWSLDYNMPIIALEA